MSDVSRVHLEHMARRHHSTMRRLEALRGKFAGMTEGAMRTIGVGAGAALGGMVEGRTAGGTVMHVPLNLAAGVGLAIAGHLDLAGAHSRHLNNLGDGLIASYVAATGYAWGKRWRETGKLFGHKQPPAALAAPTVQGELSPAQMDQILTRMQAAAASANG